MALYNSRGTISNMSDVKSGTGKDGNQWQRMTLTLDIPGYQGSITKQVFQVFGDSVNDVLLHSVGDKVEVSWSMYAREWNGKLYNNVDLVKIYSQEETKQNAPAPQQAQIQFNKPESLNPSDNTDDLPF